jgi:Tol biopolymer transport system component
LWLSIKNMILKKIFPLVFAILVTRCTVDQKTKTAINYPEPLPDSVALPFLPGIVSRDSLDFNASFSPDGNRFYFSRSGNGKWIIYMTEFCKGSWTKPMPAPFNEPEYSQADPFITSDGTLYYISNRPRHSQDTIPDYDIWFIQPQADGSWTIPENLAIINTDSTEYYVSLSTNKNLYFASNREGTLGSHDLYVSRYVNGVYSIPENLGPAVNSSHMEHDPMISPDEQFLIFTSVDRSDSYGEGDLYYSQRNREGVWSSAKNMGNKFNTDSYEYCSFLTPDNKYLFYSTNYDVKWIDAKHLPWNGR